MKFAVSIYKNKELETLIDSIDCAVLMIPHLSYVYDESFNVSEAITLCKEKGVDIIIAINRVFLERELDALEGAIEKYRDYKILVSDVGALQIAKELGITSNIIYDPDTLICNKMELGLYNSYGFEAIAMSNEITLDSVIESYGETNAPAFYQVFGRKLMFYSKRKLADIYKQYSGYEFGKENLSLVEYMRDYHTPMFYNDEGFFVYRQYHLSLLKHMNELSFLKYAYIETLTIDEETSLKVINIFKNTANIEESQQKLDELGLTIEDGFTYRDTAYIKEKTV